MATVSQHRAARSPAGGHGLGLVRRLATRLLWPLGPVSGAAGLALHGLALSGGQLVVGQPVLVSGLLFAPAAEPAGRAQAGGVPEWGVCGGGGAVAVPARDFTLLQAPRG